MRITLTTGDGRRLVAEKAYAAAHVVTVTEACKCGSLSIHGLGAQRDPETNDTYVADAVCAECKAPRGVLRAQVPTLFGIEEDEAVLRGRCRVY